MNSFEYHTNRYLIENDCTLIEMYRRIGITKANHQKYMRGVKPMVHRGYKISRFLGVPIEILWNLDYD